MCDPTADIKMERIDHCIKVLAGWKFSGSLSYLNESLDNIKAKLRDIKYKPIRKEKHVHI